MTAVAHNVNEKRRTNDVLISENVSFSNLLLSDKVLAGLKNSGFLKPSPIQLKAIPLGRCGLDLIVQAKSGTGKTCVFSVIALESICTDTSSTQVLVLAPTREIAVQIWEVIRSIGNAMKGLECHTFIGGLPLQEDRVKLKKCHIAVGSPGRIKQLIETGVLRTENIRMFVLDEADKLLEEGFQDQINWIYSTLPENKQMLALSATYPEYLADHLTAYMRNPTFLRLNISDPALLGIRQYYQSVIYHPLSHVVFEEKCKILINILSCVSFQQCLVFSNIQTRASNLADTLTNKGWPTACIAGCLDQKDRNHAMAKLKTYKCRILISTDLTARGIDADKVNLVINMDMPKDHETYLHRIGRAGRFGSFGIAVSLVSEGQEKVDMNSIEKRCNTTIHPLPDPLPTDLAKVEEPVYLNDVVSTEVIDTNTRDIKKAFLHQTPGDIATPSSVVNGDHVEESGNYEGIHKKDATADRQLTNGVNSRYENSDTKRELTVYDLSDDVKNGLHFLENKSTADIKEEVDKIETSYDTVKDNKINVILVNDTLIENQSLDEISVQPLNATGEITMHATIKSPKKPIAETQSTEFKELSSSLGRGVFQTSVRDSQPFHYIPRINDLNLSTVFKDTIGYKKQENDLTHSFAKQSLDEFRAKFTGYRESPSITLPNCSSEENKELLRKAVCQLQELFDRNIELTIDPGLSENKAEISREKLEENKNLPDSSEKQSMNLRDTLKANQQSTESCAGEVGKDIAYMDKIKQVEKVSNTNINNNKDITQRKEKTASDKGAIQKQSKSRKHYTNKFAIAYLLEPGSSVFDGDGKEVVESHREDKPLVEYDARLKKITEDPVVYDYSFGERKESSRNSFSDSKEFSGIPFQNGAAEQETQILLHGDANFNGNVKYTSAANYSSKPHRVEPSAKSYRVEHSAKPHRVEHSAKSHSMEHSAKSYRLEHSAKSNRVEQYTSDSDSDSSTSSSTDSEDEIPVQNNPYWPNLHQNSERDQLKQYQSQYYHTPYQQVPCMPQHFNYQPYMYAYQYPGIQNHWQGYTGLYQNMPRCKDPEISNQQVQSHMKNSYDMQTEYIKAMCKSMKDRHKRSKNSKKKPKTQK